MGVMPLLFGRLGVACTSNKSRTMAMGFSGMTAAKWSAVRSLRSLSLMRSWTGMICRSILAMSSLPMLMASIRGVMSSGPPRLHGSAPLRIIRFTAAPLPRPSNRCKGAHPNFSRNAFDFAPACRCAVAEVPTDVATLPGRSRRPSGVSRDPSLSGTMPLIGAPASRSCSQMTSWPRCAAKCKGVQPRASGSAGFARRPRRNFTMSLLLLCTASCSAVP
mmetsp:Transcript_42606/g.110080  ORF Transcript_42606/g.110080 Transcript_42606/m.110080 type:complete len:219 (-) Transcript_42606:556-1212(-)